MPAGRWMHSPVLTVRGIEHLGWLDHLVTVCFLNVCMQIATGRTSWLLKRVQRAVQDHNWRRRTDSVAGGCVSYVITHASIAAGVGRAFSDVCLFVCFVRTLTGQRLELSTPNLVHVYSTAVARHALTQGSKGQGHLATRMSRSHGC